MDTFIPRYAIERETTELMRVWTPENGEVYGHWLAIQCDNKSALLLMQAMLENRLWNTFVNEMGYDLEHQSLWVFTTKESYAYKIVERLPRLIAHIGGSWIYIQTPSHVDSTM